MIYIHYYVNFRIIHNKCSTPFKEKMDRNSHHKFSVHRCFNRSSNSLRRFLDIRSCPIVSWMAYYSIKNIQFINYINQRSFHWIQKQKAFNPIFCNSLLSDNFSNSLVSIIDSSWDSKMLRLFPGYVFNCGWP